MQLIIKTLFSKHGYTWVKVIEFPILYRDNEELESRALDNLGRVYARFAKFDEAIEM